MTDLVAIAYSDLATAQRAADTTHRLQEHHSLELDDLVVVERDAGGRLQLNQPPRTRDAAKAGARHGALIGLICFVPLFGAVIGGATGAAHSAGRGLDAYFIRELGQKLQPGSAALILSSARRLSTRCCRASRTVEPCCVRRWIRLPRAGRARPWPMPLASSSCDASTA